MTTGYQEYTEQEGGRLGPLPSHWAERRLMNVADVWISNVDKHSVEGEDPVRLCNYTDVYNNAEITNDMPYMVATAASEQIERFRLQRNDIVFTKDSETADDIGIPAFVRTSAPDLICGYHLAIARPNAAATPRFLYWVLASGAILRQWAVLATGVTRVGLRSTDLARVSVPVPPLSEQQQIADWLDRETSRIDVLVAKQEQLIDTLGHRRQATIDEAVRGKAGWTTSALKHLLQGIDQGSSPLSEAGLADDESWGVLKSGCVNGGVFRDTEHKRLPADFQIAPEDVVEVGDLLVSRASGSPSLVGSAGLVEILRYRLVLSDKTFRLRPKTEVSSRFLKWLLNSRAYRDQVEMSISGAEGLANNLPLSSLRSFQVAVPSPDEQRRIAAYLDEQTGRIDSLTAKAEQFISLAKERRAALITAAVTGQIDVRDHPGLEGAA